jgi:nucleoside-diphosphate-sugar epimerase
MFDHVKPVIALTGATGFLGSHLMNTLLLKGYNIIALGRPAKGESLNQRISKLLKWFGNGNYTGKLEILEIDYLKPMLGLSSEKYSLLCSKTDQIIHCASDTSFSERKREQVFEFNVHILKGLLEFASHSHAQFFHYISTAYVAGINGPICKEKLSTATEFTNVYEESKSKAEQIINDYCQKYSIPLTLIRPTIVYGDSQTGRSLRFNALYYPIRSVLNIRDIYLNDIKNHGGKRSHHQGIHLKNGGYLFLPIRIYLPKKGGINLIPVDYFVTAAEKIIENPIPGGIYHLTNHKSPMLEDIVAYNEEFMKVKGIEVLYGKPKESHPRNPAEELFDRFIAPYQPYLSDERIFESTNKDLATGNLYPPEFTSQIFMRCMEYAIEVDWGERIFSVVHEKTNDINTCF